MGNHIFYLILLGWCKLFDIFEKLFIFRVVNSGDEDVLLLYLATELIELP